MTRSKVTSCAMPLRSMSSEGEMTWKPFSLIGHIILFTNPLSRRVFDFYKGTYGYGFQSPTLAGRYAIDEPTVYYALLLRREQQPKAYRGAAPICQTGHRITNEYAASRDRGTAVGSRSPVPRVVLARGDRAKPRTTGLLKCKDIDWFLRRMSRADSSPYVSGSHSRPGS
jgi:hypothetical protein